MPVGVLAGAAAHVAAQSGGGAGLAASGALGGPVGLAITSAISLAITAIQVFRGKAHLYANDIVDNLEKPFSVALGRLVDAKDAAVASGSVTRETLVAARNGVAGMWAKYVQAAAEYAAQGEMFEQVAAQSLENLNGPTGVIAKVPESERYGERGFIDAVLEKMDRQIDALTIAEISVGGRRFAATKNNWYWFAIGGLVLIIFIRKVL